MGFSVKKSSEKLSIITRREVKLELKPVRNEFSVLKELLSVFKLTNFILFLVIQLNLRWRESIHRVGIVPMKTEQLSPRQHLL
jgi:hypothetical protein